MTVVKLQKPKLLLEKKAEQVCNTVMSMQIQNMHTKQQYTFSKDTYKHNICIKHLECLPFLGRGRSGI